MSPFLHLVDNRDIEGLHEALATWHADPARRQEDLDQLLVQLADQNGNHRAKFLNLNPMVEMVLAAGADINAQGPFGTPLALATHWGNQDLAKLLLSQGASLEDGPQPFLHLAIERNDPKLFRMLIAAGASASAVDQRGTPALFKVVKEEHHAFLVPLVKAGADPQVVDARGSNMWHALAMAFDKPSKKMEAVMRQLLEWGVDPEHQNQDGLSPREAAVKYTRTAFVQMFDGFLAEFVAGKLDAATRATAPQPPRRRPTL